MSLTLPPNAIDSTVRDLKHSATLAIEERSRLLSAEGRNVYRFGFGQSPFPVPSVVVNALRANASQKAYLPARGLWELRFAVAEYHRRRHGLPCTGDDVLIGPGSKELMFLLQLMLLGESLIPTPAWVSYAPQARLAGRPVRLLPTRREFGYLLQPAELDLACREGGASPRLLFLNYPNNPTGATYEPGELRALAEVARRHALIVLSDEIYGELRFNGPHTSIARYYPEGTIIAGGLSKWCGAGGWRLGTFTMPRELRPLLNAIAAAATETFTSTSAPIQYAAVRAFEPSSELEEYLAGARAVLRVLTEECRKILEEAGAYVVEPRAGFYLFPDFLPVARGLYARGIRDSPALAEQLLMETGVATLPGTEFGMGPEELVLRLALVDFDGARALSGAASATVLDRTFLEQHCARCLEGAQAIARFVHGTHAGGQR